MALRPIAESECDRCWNVERHPYQYEAKLPETWTKVNIWVGERAFFHLCPDCTKDLDEVMMRYVEARDV